MSESTAKNASVTKFDKIEDRHAALSERIYDAESGVPDAAMVKEIQQFQEYVSQSGALLEKLRERRRAQNILDFWSTELMDVELERSRNAGRVLLAAYEAPRDIRSEEESGSKAAPRDLIRFSAAARLWLANDKHDGYLLRGEALTKAARIAPHDADVANLVQASQETELKHSKKQTQKLYTVISALVLFSILTGTLAYISYWQSGVVKQQAELAKIEAIRAKKSASDARAAEYQSELASERLLAAHREQSRQIQQLRKEQSELNDFIDLTRKAVYHCRIDVQDLDRTIQEEIFNVAASQLDEIGDQAETVFGTCENAEPFPGSISSREINLRLENGVKLALSGSTVDRSLLSDDKFKGYNPNFLGSFLPLPAIFENASWTSPVSVPDTKILKYPNFSIALDTKRRMAVFSASNIDRSQIRILRRQPSSFKTDPRVPDPEQLEADWFRGNPIDRGHLVPRSEIAWGNVFDSNDLVASRQIADFIDRMPNITPQYDIVNRRSWSQLERYILTAFSSSSRLVTVFSGPVFSRDGSEKFGETVLPSDFWKVVVGKTVEGALEVEAYLIENRKSNTGGFEKSNFQVPVAKIEYLTGLRFSGTVVSSDRYRLDQDSFLRDEELVRMINTDPARLSPRELAKIEGVAGTLEASSLAAMPQNEVGQVLKLLALVPPDTWNLESWAFEAANVRRIIAALNEGMTTGNPQLDETARAQLEELKKATGESDLPTQTVYFRFAGMTREKAVEISKELQQLGWKIPGEERTGLAATKNEVRYGSDADKAAAVRLVADLQAAGQVTVKRAVQNKKTPEGFIEIWISI